MQNLLNIPSDILSFELFPFFQTQDIGRLDIAMSKQLRPMMFEIYATISLNHSPRGMNVIQMNWYLNRSVSVEKVCLSHNMSALDISSIFDGIRILNSTNRKYRVNSINTRYNTVRHEDVCVISQYCTSISSLIMKYCSISNTDINLLTEGCLELTVLDLTGCSDIRHETILVILQRCTKLKALNLSECHITDLVILSLTLQITPATRPPVLSTLNLGGNFELTNLAIISLEHVFTALSTLQLHGNRRITDAAIYSLAQKYPQLTALDLTACGVRQGALSALATCCQTLTSLNISHCTFVTDAAIARLIQGCRLLSKLYLNSCYLITDEAVIALARHGIGVSLREIHLSFCAAVTDTAMLALAEACRTASSSHLTVLNIRSCHIVSDKAILTLAASCGSLSTLIKPNGGKFDFGVLRLRSSTKEE